MTRDALEHNQIPLYFVAILLAAACGVFAPLLAHGLSVLITPAIAVLMYAMFLQIPFLDLRQGWGNIRFVSALLQLCSGAIAGVGADSWSVGASCVVGGGITGVVDALY